MKITVDISKSDLEFYQRVGLPLPTLSSQERLRRRLAFRNERNLYHRVCDATGKRIISFYAPESKFPVYQKDYWWGDNWNAHSYARAYDFNRPFFEQFFELRRDVPRMNMMLSHCDNCDYSPFGFYSRDCYSSISCNESESVHYSYQTNRSRDCVDCSLSRNCELCYSCVNCINCYNLRYGTRCEGCSDSWFLNDCIACRNCFGCTNLRNKEFYFLNEAVSKEVYFKKLSDLKLSCSSELEKIEQSLADFLTQFPTMAQFGHKNEGVSGHNVHQSKNSEYCYDATGLEDCKFIYVTPNKMKDCYDCNYSPYSELEVECMSAVNGYDVSFLLHSWDMKNSSYCEECFYSANLFGCVGLKRAQYCILNREYSSEDYYALRNKIIDQMKETREWGEYFPMKYSSFAYNETLANDYFPLTENGAQALGLSWRAKEQRNYQAQTTNPADCIKDVRETICSELLSCKKCQKNYKIQKTEYEFYHRMELPIPRICSDCRYLSRNRSRGLWDLIDRNCFNCGVSLQSALSESIAAKVVCEKCYQNFVD